MLPRPRHSIPSGMEMIENHHQIAFSYRLKNWYICLNYQLPCVFPVILLYIGRVKPLGIEKKGSTACS